MRELTVLNHPARSLIRRWSNESCEISQYSIVLRELTVLNRGAKLTLPNRPARIHSTHSPPDTPQRLSRDSAETPQRLYRDSTEILQRLHRDSTRALQRLCRDSTSTLQRLHRDPTETPQRLCRDSRDSTETSEILQRLSGDAHSVRVCCWDNAPLGLRSKSRVFEHLGT